MVLLIDIIITYNICLLRHFAYGLFTKKSHIAEFVLCVKYKMLSTCENYDVYIIYSKKQVYTIVYDKNQYNVHKSKQVCAFERYIASNSKKIIV